jgi:uridine kinase
MTNLPLEEVARLVLRAEPRLGAVRLVVIDGPAGSGKTTYASQLASFLADAPAIHMDDLYEGWSGLGDAVFARIETQVLAPLRAGRRPSYQRYDWIRGAFAEWVDVDLGDLLLIEGVGAAAAPIDLWAAFRVWIEAPLDLRLQRGVERDGERQRDHWLRWAEQEAVHFATDGTHARADILVDGAAPLVLPR